MVHAEEIVHCLRKPGSTLLPFAKPAPYPSPPVYTLEDVCVDGVRGHPRTQRMPKVHLNDTGAYTPLTLRSSWPLHPVPLAWALGCPPTTRLRGAHLSLSPSYCSQPPTPLPRQAQALPQAQPPPCFSLPRGPLCPHG